jgi:hypothetical protein
MTARQCENCGAFDVWDREIALDVDGNITTPPAAVRFVTSVHCLNCRHDHALGEALHARAADRPIPLHNGKLFAKRSTLGHRTLDGDKAYQLLRDKYGQEIADKAVAREATQASISLAPKSAGQKSIDAKVAAFVDELDKLGGVTRKPSTKFEEVAAKQLKAG